MYLSGSVFLVCCVAVSITAVLSTPVNYRVRIIKVLCSNGHPNYISKADCRVKLVNRTLQLFTLDISIIPNVTLTWVHFKIISYYRTANQYKPLRVNIDVDICGLYSGKVKSVFTNGDFYMYHNETNLMKGCPYETEIYTRNAYFNLSGLPQYMPDGMWRVDVEMTTMSKGKIVKVITISGYLELIQVGIVHE